MLHTKATIEKANVSEAGVIDAIVGSSSVLDRMGDIIEQDGWDLKSFLQNPVILWGHNVYEERPPIGKALKVWVQDKGSKKAKLMFKVQFDLQDSFAAEIFRKIKDGFLSTVSVGFIPHEWQELDPDNWFGGLKYTKQELLELSVVPVPANPEALIQLNSFATSDKRLKPVDIKKLYPEIKSKAEMKQILREGKKREEEEIEEVEEKPLENEHACRLRNPDDFQEGSFRSTTREHEGKEYRVIMGKLEGEDEMTEQSYRYPKDAWDESEAKSHCSEHDGTFEPAKKAVEAETKQLDDEKENPAKDTAVEEDKTEEEETDEAEEEEETEVIVNEEVTTEVIEVPVEEDDSPPVKEFKSKLEAVVKAGRVLSARNENKVRQATDLLDQVLAELDKQEEKVEEEEEAGGKSLGEQIEEIFGKGVIPYKDLGKSPESENWDGPGEIAKAEVEDLKLMCAWFDDDEADTKSAYKLPHHKAEAGHPAVWRGVAAAMASLLGARGGADIPDEDKKGVYNHLVKHYREFDKEPPEFKMVENQVLASFDEEIFALMLNQHEKHITKLIKKVLDNQKEQKQVEALPTPKFIKDNPTVTNEQAVQALHILSQALSKINMKGGDNN